MSDLKVALLQSELAWENPAQNRAHFSKEIRTISSEVDLIVLPEMFTTGFTMHPEKVAETMTGKTILWLKAMAKEKNAAITGSLAIKEGAHYYNRLVFVFPNGEIQTYDKRHTFTLAGEDKAYTAGIKKLIVTYKGWKICPMVCYDLRFPVWARNAENYDILLYVANWPKPRISAWDALLKARAIENMSYCIGVNRVGVDANKNIYTGNSAVYDCLGKKISTLKPDEIKAEIVPLDKNHLVQTREKFGFLDDKDRFILNQIYF